LGSILDQGDLEAVRRELVMEQTQEVKAYYMPGCSQ